MTRLVVRWGLWVGAGVVGGLLVTWSLRSARTIRQDVGEGAPAADAYFETASGRYHLEHGSRQEDLPANDAPSQAPPAAQEPDPDAPVVAATLPVSVEVSAPSTEPASAGPIQVRWQTADFSAAIAQVTEWVTAQQGLAVATNEHHVSIQLPQAAVAPFLERFSSGPEATLPPVAGSTAPMWATISLELIAQP